MMTTAEISNEIYKLPSVEQEVLKEKLLKEIEPDTQTISQEEFDRALFADGFLANLPDAAEDEDDDFEPVEFTGKPISETIIEERR